AHNIESIANWLKKYRPEYLFVAPIETRNGVTMVNVLNKGYFRLFPFVKDSHTIVTVQTPSQAFEAARQFGLFTRILRDFPVGTLRITIPDFHNLTFRNKQFEHAVQFGNPLRIQQCRETIDLLCSNDHIVSTYHKIISNSQFRLRVTHHDTKISNVLFDNNEKALCVIDLDTIMPGYFISDVGDMMRTYLSPVSEEEKDFENILIRENYFEAIVRGYLQEMKDELTPIEIQHFVYAGMFMIYMQALRFLTDYLENDKYYGAAYPDHNYFRARNQLTLLTRLLEKRKKLEEIVLEIMGSIP